VLAELVASARRRFVPETASAVLQLDPRADGLHLYAGCELAVQCDARGLGTLHTGIELPAVKAVGLAYERSTPQPLHLRCGVAERSAKRSTPCPT
jgi:hypothetical protein